MLKNILDTDKLYCFSPPVMIFTFLFEIIAAFYVWSTYDKHKISKIIMALLVCLSIFQLAEYNVCEGAFGISASNWSKIGFVSISMLPPLGIYLIQSLSKTKTKKILTKFSFTTAGLFSAYFLLITASIPSNICMGNYVIFTMNETVGAMYGLYYYGWLIVGLILAYQEFVKNENNLAQAIKWTGFGYLAFMLPTSTVNIIDSSTIAGIPSIMCGFAVILAFILVTKVMPKSEVKVRNTKFVEIKSKLIKK